MNTDFTQIIQYVKENALKPLSTKDVAKEFSLGTEHLSRYFTKHAGETLISYRNRVRVEKIKQLLGKPGTLEQIASKVGFSTPLEVNRAFKQITGTTPIEYRKSLWRL